MTRLPLLTACVALGLCGSASAADPPAPARPPSYSRDVRPFLVSYCISCHNAKEDAGGLDLETTEAILKGGDSGAAVVPRRPDESPLVTRVEGKQKPAMPPRKAKQPPPEAVGVLRAWVAAGAPGDGGPTTVVLPTVKPVRPRPAPIDAADYRPDGKMLAAGQHREVVLIDTGTSAVVARLGGFTGPVTAVRFNRDGRLLAAATGAAGTSGLIFLYQVPEGSAAWPAPRVIVGHRDLIYDLAFSPNGSLLASAGYDRVIKVWNASSGHELHSLKDHSDTVYGLSFSPDGGLLASAGADRAVKVWNVASGARLYTLGEATDWLYAVAWSPDGRHLAAAGVDKSIRVWDASAAGGRIIHSVFAHAGPVLRLAYDSSGRTLYSLGEDRVVKAWEAARMVERTVYPPQPEHTLTLAVRPDGKQLALGRFDGTLAVLDEATGAVLAEPLPVKPKPPQLTKILSADPAVPPGAARGRPTRLILEGSNLDRSMTVSLSRPGATARVISPGPTPGSLLVEVVFPPATPAGVEQLSVKSVAGEAAVPLPVDPFPAISQRQPIDSPAAGQLLALPVTVVGRLHKLGAVDWYRVTLGPGDELGVQTIIPPGGKLEPVLRLTDTATDEVVASGRHGLLGYRNGGGSPRALALSLRDREYRGGGEYNYRLAVGPLPVVTAVVPAGGQRGKSLPVMLEGVNLGPTRRLEVKLPADATPGSRVGVPLSSPLGPVLGNPTVVAGEFAEEFRDETSPPVTRLNTPGTGNGRLRRAGAADVWSFTAVRGQKLLIETEAERLGSPLDSVLELLDAAGKPLPQATLRSLSRTSVTFRDHDSRGTGIRLDAWPELAVNDFILVGDDLMRIWALPKNPDDDCQFWGRGGQRLAYLNTTPSFHANGTPMYKVAVHPPGTTFPANGMPVVTLFYRNDDGGPGYGKDSRIVFDPPADGEYRVRVTDARGQAGDDFFYRLTVRPPRPSFSIGMTPNPTVWRGGAVSVAVNATRIDGYEGPIEIRPENLPPGCSAPTTIIPAGETSTAFALAVDPDAVVPATTKPFKLVGRALIDGQEVVRETDGGAPKIVPPGDLLTTADQTEITVHPGHQTKLTVHIERRDGHAGRVPLEVRGLPHGVRVLDIGLNGILITERETSRTVTIYCEPWVTPTRHPFVVVARSERKGTEHAARSVLLKVDDR